MCVLETKKERKKERKRKRKKEKEREKERKMWVREMGDEGVQDYVSYAS